MSNLHKLIIAKTLYNARFWVATIIIYFTEMRGIPAGTVLQMMGVYYFMTIALEYPTGIVGDYFSHRLSVFLGYGFLAIAFVLITLPGSIPFYIGALFVLALGETLVSGSDTALLHTVSKDFSRDFATVKSYGLVMSFASISAGGFVATLDLRYPMWLTAGMLIAAAGFILWCDIPKAPSVPGNIFVTVTTGFRNVISIRPLLLLILLSCSTGGFFFAFKYFYNPLFQAIHVPLELWGMLIGGTVLIILLGVEWYKKFPRVPFLIPSVILIASIAAIGITAVPFLVLFGMFLAFVLYGYFETRITVEMNEYITEGTRASTLSLNSLLVRGAAMVFVFGSGFILEAYSLPMLFFVTAGLLAAILTVIMLRLSSLKKAAI